MKKVSYYFLPLILIGFIFNSSPKIHHNDQEALGFKTYSESIKQNGKKNLFLFEYQHCPSCDLLRNHLINSSEFQNLTKEFNRFVVELGTPLGKEFAKKYNIPASSIFVLTESDLTHESTSPFGLISIGEFEKWLNTGAKVPSVFEAKTVKFLVKKHNLDGELSDKSFREVRLAFLDESLKSKDLIKRVSKLEEGLDRWGSEVFGANESYSNFYAIAQSYFYLGERVRKFNSSLARKYYERSLVYFDKIDSGNRSLDFGRIVLQFRSYIRLGKDEKIKSEVDSLIKIRPKSRPSIYSGLTIAYFYYGESCSKALKFGEKIKITDLSVPGDQFTHGETLAKCYRKSKDKVRLKSILTKLENVLPPEIQGWYQKRFDALRKSLKDLSS